MKLRDPRTTALFTDPTIVRVAAIIGALLAVAITPFMATASFIIQEDAGPWSEGLLVDRWFGPAFESAGLLTFGPSDDTPYEVYGKAFFLVYLLMLPAIFMAKPQFERSGLAHRIVRLGWSVMFWAAVAAMVGDFLSYWGRSVPDPIGDALWSGGFGVEILAMLALILSTLVFSVANLWAVEVPRRVSVILLVGVVLLAPVNGLLTDYWPNALIFPLSIAWAVIAVTGVNREAADTVGDPTEAVVGS